MNTENTSDPRFRGDRLAPAQAGGRATCCLVLRRESQRKASDGFTLAEAMMATVILGMAAAGILLPFTTGAKVQAEGIRRTLAAKLASDLMEQIISTPSAQVDGYTYIELQGQIKDATGAVFTELYSHHRSCLL